VIHAFDADTPVEETMEALHDTVRAGKVRYLGASTMYTWQFAKMNHVAAANGWDAIREHAVPVQPAVSRGEREMLPYCRDQGIAVTTFSPLARGFLARSAAATARTAHDLYQEYYGDDIDREIARRVREVGARRGVSAAQRRDVLGGRQPQPQRSDRGCREDGLTSTSPWKRSACGLIGGAGLPRSALPAARRDQRPEPGATSRALHPAESRPPHASLACSRAG